MPGCNLQVYLSICMLRIFAACDMLETTGKETAGADMKLIKRAAAALVLLGVLFGAGCGEEYRERPAEAHAARRLTYWADIYRFTADLTNLGQLPAYRELQKRDVYKRQIRTLPEMPAFVLPHPSSRIFGCVTKYRSGMEGLASLNLKR